MAEKPTAAFVLSSIAGLIILSVAVLVAVGTRFVPGLGTLGLILAALGFTFGGLVLLGAVMLYMRPEQHVAWGIVVLIFSIASFFPTLGGFIIGMILGIVGGALGIVWKPQMLPYPGHATPYGAYGYQPGFAPPPATMQAPPPYTAPVAQAPSAQAAAYCRNCGAPLPTGVAFCPKCGFQL